jgi:hypothetical protein
MRWPVQSNLMTRGVGRVWWLEGWKVGRLEGWRVGGAVAHRAIDGGVRCKMAGMSKGATLSRF